ncbi:MAG: transglycosylase SLT domain-containing protein [Rhodanobacter sp.]
MNKTWNAAASRRLCLSFFAIGLLALGGCATVPPRNSQNICAVFDQYPHWYRDARDAQKRWGTPVNVLMAFVQRESGFREKARPARPRFLFIPLPRRSSAYGYAQAQDPVWQEYRKANGRWFKSRKDMDDSLDFLGWYTDRIHRELGISKWDPRHLYIAYHEGIGGYRSGHWRHDRHLLQTADGVDRRAREYGAQLRRCK